MPRKREVPKINKVTVTYNGDRKKFDKLIESMIFDYLNSFTLTRSESSGFSGKVEFNSKSA